MLKNTVFESIADLHIKNIHHGILTLLGSKFIATIYQEMAGYDFAGVWCAQDKNGQTLGFISGCTNLRRLYSTIILKNGIKLLLLAIPGLLSIKVLKHLSALITYPFRMKHVQNNESPQLPELLSIVVSNEARFTGIGRELVKAMENGFREWGITGKYIVSTNINEIASNAFYRSLGFRPAFQIAHHDLTLQVYEKDLPPQD
jgi:GNAT superfamily N-acetyltransferase